MTHRSLEERLQAAGGAVEIARNSQIGPYVYPKVAAEFTNGRDEQVAWRETSALFDQSHHMTDLYVEGPDVIRLFSALGVNTFQNFAVDKAKQFVACNHDGYVIGDGILFFLDENRVSLVGRPSAHNWVQFHAETGGYDVTVERDERTVANPTGKRKIYRFQVQGPTAHEVLKKANGGSLPEIKFFNMGELTIAGKKVRALHHGMSGVPGSCDLHRRRDEGLQGVVACERLRRHRLSRRQLLLRRHHGLLPDATRPRVLAVRQVRPRLRRARGPGGDGRRAEAEEGDARLERRGRRSCHRDVVREGGRREVHRLPAVELRNLAVRQGADGWRDGRDLHVLRVQLQRALVPLAGHRRCRHRARHGSHAGVGRRRRRIVEARGRAPCAGGYP